MTFNEIRKLYHAAPFRPFELVSCSADFQSVVSRISNPQALPTFYPAAGLEVGDRAGLKPALRTGIADMPPVDAASEVKKGARRRKRKR